MDIAVKAAGIAAGDEVILPTFTIVSPLFSIIRAGATPVFVDSFTDTWSMDVTQIEAKITPRTKAIVVVHIYGIPVQMDAVLQLAKKYNLLIIEDNAELQGQTCDGQICGSFGHLAIFSFYANKQISTGEGGMIVCNNPDLAARCRKLRNLAHDTERRFVHYEMGWNYRMTNMQAALGLAQLEQLDSFVEKKHQIGAFYQEQLAFITQHGYQLPLKATTYADNIYWVFGIVAPTEAEQKNIVNYLHGKKIGTRPFFWCMHEQPVFASEAFCQNQSYPVAERLARNGFYIPSGLGITPPQMQTVADVLKAYFN